MSDKLLISDAKLANDPKIDAVLHNFTDIAIKYHEILLQLLNSNSQSPAMPLLTPEKIQQLVGKIVHKMQESPEDFMQGNIEYAEQFTALMTKTMMRFWGEETKPLFAPSKTDKRFKDPAWNENIYFDFIKQFYLMTTELMAKQVKNLQLDKHTQQVTEFYALQFMNAFCPSNFALSNPKVLKESLASNWQNIARGLDNFLHDLKQSDGLLNISTSDKMFFKLGENIAATPGKVVFTNRLIELILYKPQSKVYEIPLLIIPPCINKYYIMDLSAQNSYVKWLTEQGFMVYLISWVNPTAELADVTFDDYIQDGILASGEYLRKTLGYTAINAVGYCIGGTMLATALSFLAKKNDEYIKSATFLTTLLDFSNAGEIGLFITEESVAEIDAALAKRGYFDGRHLAHSFSLLRANDLIWSFFVNNYLLGNKPLPFDLLYWNSDSSNLPAKMYSFYLHNFYLQNNLMVPNKMQVLGYGMELEAIKTPSFFLSCKEDHIALWQSTYSGMQQLKADKVFCLSGSGHVAGVINPPVNNKYSYWAGGDTSLSADDYLASCREVQGSWWNFWLEWKKNYSGVLVEETNYAKIEMLSAAPGNYVRVSHK